MRNKDALARCWILSFIPAAAAAAAAAADVDVVERNTQVRRNYTTPHKTQMIDTTINLLVNRTECTNLSGTTLTLRLAVKSDNSSPAILFRDSEKLDATIKLSLTPPVVVPMDERNHVSPIIIFRNFINFDPCSGFVIKSPIISSVGQYFTFKFP